MRILIVDDNPTSLKLLRAQLEAEGYQVCAAEDGVEALALLQRETVDAVISDILMPRMHGYRLCSEVRKDQRLCHLPFIFYTSTCTSPTDERLALDLTADAFLRKPASPEVIVATLRSIPSRDRSAEPRAIPATNELDLMKEYSERLVAKLEEKNIELQHQTEVLKANEARLLLQAVALETAAKTMRDDLAERERLEEQFIQSQKMEVVGHLAGGVAHDFNNILSVIIGYSDLIISDLGPDHPLQEYCGEIRHAADRASGLTQQLLFFSRKQKLHPVILDLNQILAGMDKMLRRLIDEHIGLTVRPGKEIGRFKADSNHIGQILMNLVVNARDAMPGGGTLTIETRKVTLDEAYSRAHPETLPGDYVMLAVTDSGIGMTDEVKSRLFEPFFTTKPAGKGTGLGLATCMTIAKQSQGHIDFESDLGHGTTFRVYFPSVEQALEPQADPRRPTALPRGAETLLLVEDEPSLRHLGTEVLETQGYTVLSATNGRDALNLARAHRGSPLSLVVTDVIMPQMGGKVMAEWLQATYPHLKVLFTSGYTDDAIAQDGGLDHGAAFLPKPYTPATLVRKVRELLDSASPRNPAVPNGAEPDACVSAA